MILNILLILCVGDKFCGKKNQIAKYVCTYKIFPGQPLVYAVFWIFLWNSFSAPLLSPMVTNSDSVPFDDRPSAIGFCSALCLPGVALVGVLLLVVWL